MTVDPRTAAATTGRTMLLLTPGMLRRWLGGLLLLLGLSLPAMAGATETPVWECGLRGGMNATGSRESYVAGEVYLLRDLPWRAAWAGGTLGLRLDGGVGYLEADNDRGSWLAAGVDLVNTLADGRIALEAGFRPVWLADNRFGSDDLGGGLQFSSHAGIAVNLAPLSVGYRFLHLSNAGIYDSNPGINLHLFGIGVRF